MSYDVSDIVKTVKKAFKNEKISSKVGLATELKELGPEDFVRLGSWWTESTGTYGIPFGRITTLAGNADSGKCLGKDTPVLLFDGTVKKVQDITINDKLMGPDSKKRTILSISRGEELLYKITPNYGNLSWVCNESHILSLKASYSFIYNKKKYLKGSILNISVKDYLKLPVNARHALKQYHVSVEWKEKPVSIDPYYLGLWLGDGTSSLVNQVTTADRPIKNYLYDLAKAASLSVRVQEQRSNKSEVISLTKGLQQKTKNSLVEKMRALGVEKNKHIPFDYLCNSSKIRLALLAGLLDSDGYLNKTGKSCYEITQKNKNLINDIVFLSRSLGFRTKLSEKIGSISSIGFNGTYYRLTISGDVNIIPCKLRRKRAVSRKGNKAPDVTGITVTKLKKGSYFGFTLKENPLFLLGDFTVTHNTSIAIQAMKAALEQGCGVVYAETENKTTEKDMKAWGVDPSQVIIVSSTIAEEMYELTLAAWDAFKDKYPEVPLLVIIDSIGNLISMRDEDIDMLEQNSMPGGKGKANRLGLSRIVAKMNRDNAAVLLVSYVYDNMGSPGKKTAGGEALHLYSVLMYQTSRKGWLEKTVQGVKQRIGAEVKFTLQKNHLNKDNPGLKEIFFRITKDGIEFVNKGTKAEEDDFDS